MQLVIESYDISEASVNVIPSVNARLCTLSFQRFIRWVNPLGTDLFFFLSSNRAKFQIFQYWINVLRALLSALSIAE